MQVDQHTHTHTHLTALFPRLPGSAGIRKVKPIWILLKQERVSGSGISWAVCKSAPCSRQITMSAPHHSVFTGWMPFLPPNQQRQSTEGNMLTSIMTIKRWLLFSVALLALTSNTDEQWTFYCNQYRDIFNSCNNVNKRGNNKVTGFGRDENKTCTNASERLRNLREKLAIA